MDQIYGNNLEAKLRDVGKASYGSGAGFIMRCASADGVVKSRENFGSLKSWHVEKTAPDFGGRETSGFEARNDAEIVGAAFESAPKIGIGQCGGNDDGA